jgi:hypothetical protein
MSPQDDRLVQFEEQARGVLAESVTRIDSGVRSRLNQARQAAIAEVARPGGRRPRFFLMPAAGAVAAAALVAMVLWQRGPHTPSVLPVNDGGQVQAEDLDLIADTDGLDMLQDSDGAFYEWATAQADAGAETST